MQKLAKAGCDFFVITRDAPLDMPEDPETAKVLQVDDSLSDGLLRTVNALPADAVMVMGEEQGKGRLTWGRLMFLQRVAELLTKPVLASGPLAMSEHELQALWNAGIDGIVVPVAQGRETDLKTLRRTIDGLTLTSRQGKKLDVMLPRTSEERETRPEPEPEEEDEE
jgi:hypothetical protein